MIGTILGAATSIGSSIYGAIKSSEANKRAESMIQNQKVKNQKWYDQKMNADYTQRPDVQNVLRKQRELLQEQYKAARARNLVAGGTDESLALQQAQANEALSNTMGDIAGQAANYKEGIEQQYLAGDASLTQQLVANEQNKANSIAKAAGQVGSAVSGLVQGGNLQSTTTPAAATPSSSSSMKIDNTPAYTEAQDRGFLNDKIAQIKI